MLRGLGQGTGVTNIASFYPTAPNMTGFYPTMTSVSPSNYSTGAAPGGGGGGIIPTINAITGAVTGAAGSALLVQQAVKAGMTPSAFSALTGPQQQAALARAALGTSLFSSSSLTPILLIGGLVLILMMGGKRA